MRDPDHVLDQIRTRYRKNWRDWLIGGTDIEFSFTLAAPTAQMIARESDHVGEWMRVWRVWAEVHPTATLRRADRRTIVGIQETFTHLDIPSVDDLATLDQELADHWTRARSRWTRIRALPRDVAEERIRPFLQQIVDMDHADFEILLNATEWFTANPRSGLTIRQVPVRGMHTKWLASNRRLVLACLDIAEQPSTTNPPDDEMQQDDLDPLGLKALPVHIDVILADSADRTRIGGLRHLNAPLPEIAALPIKPTTVLIVENKESAYLVPDRPRTVVIHSLGNHLNALDEINWLNGTHQLYWGDIDRAGFTLLSRTRRRLRHIVSVLMDADTLARHNALTVEDTTRADPPEPGLTDAEANTLAALSTKDSGYLRLEQERLSPEFVLAQLERAMRRTTFDEPMVHRAAARPII